MQTDSPDYWRARDFVDQLEPDLSYDDPWASPGQSSSPPSANPPNVDNRGLSQSSVPKVAREKDDKSRPVGYTTKPPTLQPVEYVENAAVVPIEWFNNDLDTEPDEESQEEPVPTAEFDPYLSEELYQESEFVHVVESIDLSYDAHIRLDSFLAGVGLSKQQDIEIREYLEKFSRSRLSNWLPWLRSKLWTGQTLLMFIQFHSHWESNPEWWESRWYHRKHGWRPKNMSMSNILTRDDAYAIVHLRLGFHPEVMIDFVWFDEWDYHSLWRHGFYSFASFAKFRSTLNDGEEWKSLILCRIDRENVESHLWRDGDMNQINQLTGRGFQTKEDSIPPYSHISSLPRWYDIQDWHPKSEWHDNLGWNIPSLDPEEARFQPDGSQGPIWPFGGRNE